MKIFTQRIPGMLISPLLPTLIVCTAALTWGQESAISRREDIPSRVIVNSRGQKAHIHLSAPMEAKLQKALRRQREKGVGKLDAGFGGTPPTATNLVYNGGPVMRNPTNYLIFWQPPGRNAFPAGYQTAIEKFFQDVGGTPFYNIVTQYGDSSGNPVPNATSLGAPSFTDTTTAPPSGNTGLVGSPLQDSDIQNEIGVALAANPSWASPSVNVEYFVFTPSDVDECFNSTNCFAVTGEPNGAFCAYHSNFNTSTIYAYQPFASVGSCFPSAAIQNLGYPNGVTVDVVLGEVSHEMFESNTDPEINGGVAWQGTNGGADEIGDKCNFVDGYVAPDGTNVVLNGRRYKIQEEFSNDITACTKRYGPDPVTASPAPVAFGEVESGTSAQQNLSIQNNGGGDLNILNVRVNSGSPYYSLVNSQPTGATLHASESLTEQIQFAPASNAAFGSPTGTVVVDTDQTPCLPINSSCATSSTTAFANITGTVGVPPDALCASVLVPTDLNLCSTANASVNNGSTDPDGEAITVTQSPAGPYTLGTTAVTLTVTDQGPDHASASCKANITVQDKQKPTITCPAAQTVQCTSSSGAAASITPTFFDNCPAVTASCVPPSGSTFGFGTTPVTCTATDGSGNMNSCSTSVTVVDVPPVIQSVVAAPNILTPPNKKLDHVTILVKDTDACDPNPVCSISAVTSSSKPLVAGVDYVITGPLTLLLRAAGNGGHGLTYIVTVTCKDAHGGSTSAQTTVQAP